MDLPATLVGPDGEELVVNDARTYNQLRFGYGWFPQVAPVPEPAIVSEPEPAPEPAPLVELSEVSSDK